MRITHRCNFEGNFVLVLDIKGHANGIIIIRPKSRLSFCKLTWNGTIELYIISARLKRMITNLATPY